ncbi:unnamed protein product [Brachionus calyciflorus]|uniref:Peptidase S1 domain-containing protein n=1 Tax=Brachionus calyciflorus TaxID=104777 RepID=A0A813WP30_9BILA|nr:unnamed protein product [Brachionus calyciflorus]
MKIGDANLHNSSLPSLKENQKSLDKQKKSKNFKSKLSSLSKTTKILICSTVILALSILITIIILLSLLATVPCNVIKCHSKASKCINNWFKVECICDYGYQGDGFKYCDECGLTSVSKNVKIIGGIEAMAHSWPSSVYLRFSYRGNVDIKLTNGTVVTVYAQQNGLCGGSLIDRKHVLTAAHCIRPVLKLKLDNKDYYVRAKINNDFPTLESMYKLYFEVHNLSKVTSSQVYSIKEIIAHENYDESTILNDIAILKLDKEVELNERIQLACLPNYSLELYPSDVNIKSWVQGWGLIEQANKTLPSSLQNVQVTIYDMSYCTQMYPRVPKSPSSQICAGDVTGEKGSCFGDSGGALFILDKIDEKSKFVAVGLVSYGNGSCTTVNLGQIYTRISYFSKWIQSKKFLD